MGNSHNSKNGSHHRKPIEYIDAFFKWIKYQNPSHDKEFILKYFNKCLIIKIIFENNYDMAMTNLHEFLYTIAEAFTGASVSQIFVDILYFNKESIEISRINQILNECALYMLSNVINSNNIHCLSESSKKSLEALVKSIRTNDGFINKSQLQQWILSEFPEIFYGYSNWILNRIKEKSMLVSMNLNETNRDLSEYMNVVTTWYLCSNLSSVYLKGLSVENVSQHEKLKNCLLNNKWTKLFASDRDGLSLNRFQNHVFNYKGPTVIFFHCDSEACYCVCSDQEYRESPTPYGSSQIKVFQLWPRFKDYEITNSSKCIYLNTRSKGLRLGFIFGDGELSPILKIDENFQYVNHESKHSDLLVACEAWGCGDANSLERQLDLKKWESKQIEKMRTVKLNGGDWNEHADKAILDLAGVTTEHAQRGDF